MAKKISSWFLLFSFWSAFSSAEVTDKPGLDKEYDPLSYGYRGEDNFGANVFGKTGEAKRSMEEEETNQMEDVGGKSSALALIVRELGDLKEALNVLKTQNNILYKQLKAFHKTCSATASSPASGAGHPDDTSSINNAIQSDALRLNPLPPKTLCPEDFTFSAEHNGCYKLTADRVTWRMARERCLAQNADLVTVESTRKQRFLIERAKSSPETRHCDFWIGLYRHSSSLTNWKWSFNDETPTFTNWNFNEPNNGKGNEHCVQMLWIFHWKWNDAACNYGNACYICQTQPYA